MKYLVLVAAAALASCTSTPAPTPPLSIPMVNTQVNTFSTNTLSPTACTEALAMNYAAQSSSVCANGDYTAFRVHDDLALGEGECSAVERLDKDRVRFFCQANGEKQQIVTGNDTMLALLQ